MSNRKEYDESTGALAAHAGMMVDRIEEQCRYAREDTDRLGTDYEALASTLLDKLTVLSLQAAKLRDALATHRAARAELGKPSAERNPVWGANS